MARNKRDHKEFEKSYEKRLRVRETLTLPEQISSRDKSAVQGTDTRTRLHVRA